MLVMIRYFFNTKTNIETITYQINTGQHIKKKLFDPQYNVSK